MAHEQREAIDLKTFTRLIREVQSDLELSGGKNEILARRLLGIRRELSSAADGCVTLDPLEQQYLLVPISHPSGSVASRLQLMISDKVSSVLVRLNDAAGQPTDTFTSAKILDKPDSIAVSADTRRHGIVELVMHFLSDGIPQKHRIHVAQDGFVGIDSLFPKNPPKPPFLERLIKELTIDLESQPPPFLDPERVRNNACGVVNDRTALLYGGKFTGQMLMPHTSLQHPYLDRIDTVPVCSPEIDSYYFVPSKSGK